ncbi:uncharacterized protein LOC142641992 isoform X3 [Castanea sativa]|uniref:uncharacterized protein LOC142641992 isoform X3 n=1 Tax=Castanea sativa TaxID=21020 RepID=UPI003F64C389
MFGSRQPKSVFSCIQTDSTSLERPIILDKPKGVSSGSSTLKEGMPRVAQENQNQHQSVENRYLAAALRGNWQSARAILEADRDAVRRSLTETRESVLHIAFASKHTAFVKEVVRFLTPEELEQKNVDGDTALCFAAKSGTVTIAKAMLNRTRNSRLLYIRNSEYRTPLHIAAKLGSREMTLYLYSKTELKFLSTDERMEILMATITNDMYGMSHISVTYIALDILRRFDALATTRNEKTIAALRELAKKPFAFGSNSQLSLWKRRFNFCIRDKTNTQALVQEMINRISIAIQDFPGNRFSNIFLRTPLFDAAEFGNAEFLIILIRTYPDMIWTTNNFHQSLFHIAVINRQESVFKLIHEMGAMKEIILTYVDTYKQNILHLAGKLAPKARLNLVPGAALRMQRELLWFKEVERIVPPSYPKMRDNENRTPWDLFTEEHKELRREGEKWMKDTVNFYIVVATLITGVVFAATFTVPGGSNQDTGIPIFSKSIWFRVLLISDAIALVFSSTSILMFLSILTSCFTEMDFLVSLPTKLELGVTALFISIAGMLVAFSATCCLVLKSEMASIPIVIFASASVPIILFVRLHYQFWVDIIRSTFSSRFLFGPLNDPFEL